MSNDSSSQIPYHISYSIPYYLDYLPAALLKELEATGEAVDAVPGLVIAKGLRDAFPHIETDEALSFTCDLYRDMRDSLSQVLNQRQIDRDFMDRSTASYVEANRDRDYTAADYETAIGKKDAQGRVVIGPLEAACNPSKVEIPEFLRGDQVTLFGPPDTAKLAINAMNAVHRKPANEPAIVSELAEAAGQVPRWGADNEDSKTPIMVNFLQACENLKGCFDGTLELHDEARGKTYQLAKDNLSKPIKRIPGLALPDGSHLLDGNPLPLHLFDFALHLWHNRSNPEALVFYIPKLENEEEAAYFKQLIDLAESRIKIVEPDYELGTIKLFIVFENPRAIFRIKEIAKALEPHFLGGSLGWHDFLGSTARLFKNDPRYRIPVKADPNIVINHIRESHRILAQALAPIGAIRIGGMYGVLYEKGNPASYEVSMVGYIRDVTTQLKRDLNGFWVAHPAFVRIGLALVEAWRRGEESVRELVEALVPNPTESDPLLAFVFGDDLPGLDREDPLYHRAVLAASLETSDVISNDHPDEVRYNIFQAIQYLCDWLSGNGCVALPATMTNAAGESIFVRIMDDLATTERSRWELWAEVAHGRVSVEDFRRMLDEELAFIEAGEDLASKRIQVQYQGDAQRWYPIAKRILDQLVTDENPVEFATELLLPFTMDVIRESEHPWQTFCQLRD